MGRKSRFDGMDSSILAEVDRLIRQGKTILQIREHLALLGEPVSHGAAGRYVQRARAHMARYREAQEIAGQWVEQIGETPRGDVGVLLAELLKTVAFNTLDTLADGESKPTRPADIMFLAKAIRDLEETAKKSMERRHAIEQAALKRQADKAESVAKARGMTDADWDAIRAKFLGVDEDAQG